MIFGEWAAAYRDRHARAAALLIWGLLLGVLGFDWWRVSAARGKLASSDWSRGVLSGLITGAILLVLAAVLWRVAHRHRWARSPIATVAAVATVLLFVATHPRYQDDAVGDTWELGLLIGVDMLFTVVLMYAAIHRRTRKPLLPRKYGARARKHA